MRWKKELAFEIGVGGGERERKQTPIQMSMCLTRIVISKGHRLAKEMCYLPMAGREKSQRHIKLTLNICHSILFKTSVH